ncbi:RagB/SusD family nutrient uptake outer membrane protein [Mucilaginibacter daejeonensis]|uniref:RagB/SusD family nutrient uptake outer membrane protein n=1 Tax=Mucilaginibacter daejeonensis TaxID=398049 RepID=UPI001D174112|nr:RagB/SusD family nutrient uptake outer membrane protein [Mucilaginibacter daejeonensis]UEG52183.1 RagB/SusD family nutrient uptake outer membrane protein [Mucilaginibacter daejeonensis]
MKHIRSVISFCTLFLLFSCSKEALDTNPTGGISDETAFVSVGNAQKALNGIYRILYTQYTNQHRDGHGAIMINLDAMGEDYVRTNASYVYHYQSYRWLAHRNSADDNVNGFAYYFYYIVISNANQIIERIDGVEGDAATKSGIKGEALALRAWAHFNLVQLYGKRYSAGATNSQPGIPIVITTTTEGQPRSTVEAVYTQINKDLDDAIVALAKTPAARTGSAKTHININVAKGFKARVALTMQNWASAIKFAQEARAGIDNLMSNTQYTAGFTDINNPEWMWGIIQPADQVPTYGSFYAYMSANFNSAFTRVNPKLINSLLYAKISSTDIRKKLWWNGTAADRDNFPNISGQTKVIYMHRKFLVPDVATRAGDIPYMRIAEMYLIEAEAQARSGNNAAAAQALLPLAKNRDASYTLSTKTGAALIDEIMVQRRIELWGEGFRFLDLKRTNADLDRRNANHKVDVANILFVAAGDPSWQWLIPQDEINSNPAIEPGDQNP